MPRTNRVRLDTIGRIYIPKHIRQELGLREGESILKVEVYTWDKLCREFCSKPYTLLNEKIIVLRILTR